MIKCEICNKELKNMRALSTHIQMNHKITSKEYYDKYLKKEDEGICIHCGKSTQLENLSKGYRLYCSNSCKYNDLQYKEKIKQANLERYGVEYLFQLPKVRKKALEASTTSECINKRKETMIKHFGVEASFCRKDVQNKLWTDECREKRETTMMSKYGVKNNWRRRLNLTKESITKATKTKHKNNVKKYGYKEVFSIPSIREKSLETKKKNGTFNTSKLEEDFYTQLLEVFNKEDIKRQYNDKRYPYNCDFYIKSLDLFIECNFHWTHGGHWFDENSKDDIKQLEKWKSKNTKYYRNAIETWTVRDVKKKEIAEKNNLNYIVFWDEFQLFEYFKGYL